MGVTRASIAGHAPSAMGAAARDAHPAGPPLPAAARRRAVTIARAPAGTSPCS
jgi:hypothetical protein